MLRDDFDISDEEFYKVVTPFDEEIKKYIEDNVLYDYLAFYLAVGYRYNALWAGNLIQHLNSSIESLTAIQFKNNFDYTRVNEILKNKYDLIIANDTPLEFKSIKKEDQQLG